MLVNKNGITVKELKQFVNKLDDVDIHGNDCEVWLFNPDNITSNQAKSIHMLNASDIILGSSNVG